MIFLSLASWYVDILTKNCFFIIIMQSSFTKSANQKLFFLFDVPNLSRGMIHLNLGSDYFFAVCAFPKIFTYRSNYLGHYENWAEVITFFLILNFVIHLNYFVGFFLVLKPFMTV